MDIAHKDFYCKRIIISLIFSIFLILANFQAHAYDSLYIVEDVKVDVSAKDSVSAQQQAFAKAQAIAFSRLTKRMVAEGEEATIKRPDFETISTMVNDYEVKDEKISAVRYVGNFTFRFNEKAVSRFFSVSGVHYTDKSSKPLLILPIFQVNGKNTIWSEKNIWLQAWGRSRLPNGVVPVEVPIGDLDDIGDIDDNNALSYERKSLDRMLLRYGAKEAAIMIAVPDLALSALSSEDKATGQMRISIYRTDRGKAERVSDVIVKADGSENVSQLYDRAVLMGYQALQRDWKNKTVASSSQEQLYMVRVGLNGLRDLVKIKTILRTVTGVRSVEVASLKPVEAKFIFVFRGGVERLREALSHSSLSLGEAQQVQKRFVNNEINKTPNVIYDLFMEQKRSKSFYKPAGTVPIADNSSVRTF